MTNARSTQGPEVWNLLKFTLRWIVFEDRRTGNFVIVDPHRDKPLGTPGAMKRPPTIYLGTTDQELESALEEMLFLYQRSTRVNSRHVSLVERVQDAMDRHHGRRKVRQAA